MTPQPIRTTEEITRVALNRSISSEIWLNLIKSNSKLNNLSKEILEIELINSLLKLLLEQQNLNLNLNSNSLIIQYFSILLPTTTIKEEEVEINSKKLIIEIILNFDKLSVKNLNLLFDLIYSDNNKFNKEEFKNLNELELLKFIKFSIEIINLNLNIKSNFSTSSTLIFILNFFKFQSFIKLSSSSTTNLTLKEEIINSLNLTRNLLKTTINTSTNSNPFLIQLLNFLPFVKTSIDSTSITEDSSLNVPSTGSKSNSAQPDVIFSVVDLMTRRTTPDGISNTEYTILRIQTLLQTRIKESTSSSSTTTSTTNSIIEIISNTFLEILIVFWDHTQLNSVTRSLMNELYEISLCSRLPEILKGLFDKNKFDSFNLPRGLQGCLEIAVERLKGRITGVAQSSERNLALLERILKNYTALEIISKEFALSLSSNPSQFHIDESTSINLESDTIQSILSRLTNPKEEIRLRSTISSIQSLLESYCTNYNLQSLASLCTILLIPQSKIKLEILFLFLQPREILVPIRFFLDSIDTTQDRLIGEGHSVEKYGIIAHFLLIIMSRFNLHQNQSYHLGTSTTFVPQWINSLSSVYSLNKLDFESSSAINNWIRDLFGEGISDELMQSTDPRVLLRISPTICKQSLLACQMGIIDLDTLKEGLSYLLNDILNFTLPGVLLWLISEIGRSCPSSAQNLMIDLLQLLIFSELLPTSVLELIGPSLNSLVLNLSISTSPPPTSLDIIKINLLTVPFCESSSGALNSPSQSTWLQQLSIDITPTILDSTPTYNSNLSISLYKSLEEFTTTTILNTIFKILLENIRPSSPITSIGNGVQESQNDRIMKLRRIGRSLIGISNRLAKSENGNEKRRFNLLEMGSKDYLVSYAQELNYNSLGGDEKEQGLEKIKIELILNIFEDAFWAAEFMERELSMEGQGGSSSSRIQKSRQELNENFLRLKSSFEGVGVGVRIEEKNNLNLFVEGILGRVACTSSSSSVIRDQDVDMRTE